MFIDSFFPSTVAGSEIIVLFVWLCLCNVVDVNVEWSIFRNVRNDIPTLSHKFSIRMLQFRTRSRSAKNSFIHTPEQGDSRDFYSKCVNFSINVLSKIRLNFHFHSPICISIDRNRFLAPTSTLDQDADKRPKCYNDQNEFEPGPRRQFKSITTMFCVKHSSIWALGDLVLDAVADISPTFKRNAQKEFSLRYKHKRFQVSAQNVKSRSHREKNEIDLRGLPPVLRNFGPFIESLGIEFKSNSNTY